MLVAAAYVDVAAHDGPHAAVVAGPSSWDLAVLALLVTAGALYARGSRRLAANGARVRGLERVSFWAGWTTLVVAVAPWMDTAAAWSFSAHMAQHELLTVVGAPLLIAGRPIVPWLWALPPAIRRAPAGPRLQGSALALWRGLTQPLVAWTLHGAAIWVWHVPAFYEAAVESEAVHALQHATFVGTAICFWWGLVYGRYGRAAYGASVLYVFTTMVHTGALGALLALSTTPFYAVYRDRAALAGLDPVTDQQLAGLYMWVPAGVLLTLFGLALLIAWMAEAERRAGAARLARPRSSRAAISSRLSPR